MEVVFLIVVFLIGAFAFSVVVRNMLDRLEGELAANVAAYGRPVKLWGERIPMGYPLLALLGGCSAVLSVGWFGRPGGYGVGGVLRAALVFVLLAILTVISLTDIMAMKIPKELVRSVFVCGMAAAALFPEPGILSRIGGVFAVSLPMAGLACCVRGAFGGGDIKLMAAAGLFLGWRGIAVAFAMAILTAGGYCLYLLAAGKKDRKGQFAFGPFLCTGIAVSAFLGEMLLLLIAV